LYKKTKKRDITAKNEKKKVAKNRYKKQKTKKINKFDAKSQ